MSKTANRDPHKVQVPKKDKKKNLKCKTVCSRLISLVTIVFSMLKVCVGLKRDLKNRGLIIGEYVCVIHVIVNNYCIIYKYVIICCLG